MTLLCALHKITRVSQTGPKKIVVGYDPLGNPIERVNSESLLEGMLFDHPEPEASQLIEMGAARLPTEAEDALGKGIIAPRVTNVVTRAGDSQ